MLNNHTPCHDKSLVNAAQSRVGPEILKAALGFKEGIDAAAADVPAASSRPGTHREKAGP